MFEAPTNPGCQNLSKVIIGTSTLGREAAVLAILVLTVPVGTKTLLGSMENILPTGPQGCWLSGGLSWLETEQWFEGTTIRPALTEHCPVGME